MYVFSIYFFILDYRERRELLERCASTTLNSKLIAGAKDVFSKMVVDAVLHLDDSLSLDMIGVKKVPGGSMEVSLCLRAFELNLFTPYSYRTVVCVFIYF